MLIRSSLLWLTHDQVFLFDVQRSTSGYCMREYKYAYCSGQSYSASSSVHSQPRVSIARAFPAFAPACYACAFKDSRMRGRRGFCTLVHSLLHKEFTDSLIHLKTITNYSGVGVLTSFLIGMSVEMESARLSRSPATIIKSCTVLLLLFMIPSLSITVSTTASSVGSVCICVY